MTKLSLITAEAITVNKDGHTIPCVVLIGRDEQGKKRTWRTPYWSYLYIKESDFLKVQDDKEINLDKYIKEYLGTFVRSLNKKALTKLILYDYKYIDDVQTLLRKYGKVEEGGSIYTYEADLSKLRLLALRYLIDKGIRSGVIIREDNSIEPVEADVNLRIWYIDFEAYTSKMCSYGLKKEDPITMISFYDSYEDTLYTYYVNNKKWKTLPIFKKIVDKHIIKGFKSEALFLDGLRRKVEQLDPDLFTAWNLDRYDIVKWFQRMKANRLHPNLLSPLKSVLTNTKPYRIKGRILYDLMKAYKKFTASELRSYSLLNVIEEEKLQYVTIGNKKIKLEKIPFKGSAADTWDKYPQIVFKRNVLDVLVLIALNRKHELVEMFDDLRKEFGCLWQELFMNSRILDTALMRFIHNKLALNTAGLNIKQEGKFLGAIVVNPKVGKYKYVAIFDFCLTHDAEVLTFDGWKRINKVTFQDKILTYNIESNRLEYQHPTGIYEFPIKTRRMTQILNNNFDILSTQHHKTLYRMRRGKNKGKLKISFAKDVPTYVSIPVARPYIGTNFLDKEIIMLIGWIISEGHFHKKSEAISIYQTNKNPRYVNEIRILLETLGIKYTERIRKRKRIEYEFYIKAEDGRLIRSFIKSKRLTKYLLNLKPSLSYCLLKTLMKGDGSFRTNNCWRYASKDKVLADQVQELALKLGFRSKVVPKEQCWITNITLSEGDAWINSYKKDKRDIIHYGKVYCLSVPNGFFVARRKGKAFITGNSREYPNIMKTFNISPETYRKHPYKGQCYRIKYREEVFTFIKKPIGLLPQLINFFFKKRDEYEKKMEEAVLQGNEIEIKKWKRRIFHIKGLTNAIYGVMDFPSFRLYRKECSAAVAVTGRISIEQLEKIAKKLNYDVIYGDSDSIFVALKFDHPATALIECLELEKVFNEKLSKFFIKKYKVTKAPSVLGLEKICDNFLMLGRKFYAGRYIYDEKKEWNVGEDNFIFKGLEIVRSDSSDLEKETLTTIIKMILTEKKHKDIKDYWSKVTKNFWNKVYDYLQVAYPLQIKKPFRYYAGKDKNGKPKTIPSHVRAALVSNTLLNTDFEAWDKPRRLPIKSKKRIKVKLGRQFREFIIKDIAVAEDMLVDEKYLDAIDWKRIYDRLSDKVAKIFKLIYIQSTLIEDYS